MGRGRVRIGTSGWNYPGWRGRFYPVGLPQARELEYATRAFDSIELNGTFYSLRRPDDFRRWRAAAPPGFVYAVKGSRFITHNKKLKDAEAALETFFGSGVLDLGDRLGPFVWQLPRQARFDPGRLQEFFGLLPRLVDRRRLRHAIEVRHDSFFTEAFVRLCRRFRVAVAVSDAADWPMFEALTTGFAYVRLHGHTRTYASDYDSASLAQWAAKIRAWTDAKLDVYVYFDNDAEAHAPRNARELARLVHGANGTQSPDSSVL